MGRAATSQERRRILDLIKQTARLEDWDIIYANPLIQSSTGYDHLYTCRIDYSPVHKRGGYQVFEGDLLVNSCTAVTAVLGIGRVTPRRSTSGRSAPIVGTVYTKPVKSKKEQQEERDQLEVELKYNHLLDDGRIA